MTRRAPFGRFLLGLLLILLASLALFYGLMQPALGDLSLMTTFLLVVAIGLAFASVWATARLMFASEHDLLLATVLLLFAAGMAAVLGAFLSSGVIDRIRQLETAAHRIERGELTARAAVQGNDELASLGNAFNRMASQLETAAARQTELERMRRDLVAWAGHDLQTPLTSIRAILEAVADGVIEDPATRQQYLHTAQRSLRDLSHLIDDLFEVAQLQAGSFRLNLEASSLNDLISDTVESFSGQIAGRGIHLAGRVAPGVDPVTLDPARIGRVLTNLLANALRHTPDGGRITIEATGGPAQVRISVSDNGEEIG